MNIQVFPDLTGFAPKHDRYHAYDVDTYDGAEDGRSPMGAGATPEEAIADLLEQLEDS